MHTLFVQLYAYVGIEYVIVLNATEYDRHTENADDNNNNENKNNNNLCPSVYRQL